jgi:hypothetical protein
LQSDSKLVITTFFLEIIYDADNSGIQMSELANQFIFRFGFRKYRAKCNAFTVCPFVEGLIRLIIE